jgi:hypothetical protein
MNMENNLKPCPLCNSTENLMVYAEWLPDKKPNGHEVGVVECTNQSCPMIIRAITVEEAVRKWNKRPREDFLTEQNKALAEQLVIDEIIENDLRAKLADAINALEHYANYDFSEKPDAWAGTVAIETLAKIKAESVTR